MDRTTWILVRAAAMAASRKHRRRGRRPVFSDLMIVLIYLWMVSHDRTQKWACLRSSYGTLFRPRRLPSESQLSRRLRSEGVIDLLQAVHEELSRSGVACDVMFMDAKALPVSENTRDRDARTGRCNGGFRRGYKVHALSTLDGRVPVWHVTPMNVADPAAAPLLLTHARALGKLVLADTFYDGNGIYRTTRERGSRLLTPLKGIAKSARAIANTDPDRLRAAAAWTHEPQATACVYRQRSGAERNFANLTNYAGGLTSLPPWVRGLRRVRSWVGAKIILYHARRLTRQDARRHPLPDSA